MDFGKAGQLFDPDQGRLRQAWAFVMPLAFSRHQYVEFVFDQTVATWCRCHRAAFERFHGVTRRVVIENLKAAIVHTVFYGPEVQRVYRECAEHHGFLIAPCRVRTPEHKGKVEQGGVHYVTRNCLAGRAFRDIHDENAHALRWCLETAGRRLWVRGTSTQVQCFHDHALVASHLAARPGQVALVRHPGPNNLSPALMSRARAVGPLTTTSTAAPPVEVPGP